MKKDRKDRPVGEGVEDLECKIKFTNGKEIQLKGELKGNSFDMEVTGGLQKPLGIEDWEADDVRIIFEIAADQFRALAQGQYVPDDHEVNTDHYRDNTKWRPR